MGTQMDPTSEALRYVRLVGATGQLRVAQFAGRDHLVVPVTALMEAVIWPVNAPEPEFVPASVLAVAPSSWNGRPVVLNHPTEPGGGIASANDPRRLEAEAFGTVFNSRFAASRLEMEAWLDPLRADRIGARAMRLLEKVRNGEPVEVSVGGYVIGIAERGRHNGRAYGLRWMHIYPDHLAFLEEGHEGACSVSMGCGTRAAMRHLVSAAGLTMDEPPAGPAEGGTTMTPDQEEKRSLRERLWALVTFRGAASPDSMSDQDLRTALAQALTAAHPATFRGIETVFPGEARVVYAVDSDPGGPGPIRLYQRNYTLGENGTVTLEGEMQPVIPVMRYEPVAAEAAATGAAAGAGEGAAQVAAGAPCGCGGTGSGNAGAQPQVTPVAASGTGEGGVTMERTQRIRALVDNPQSPWSADQEAFLAGLSDEQFAAFEAAYPAQAAPAAAAAAAPAVAAVTGAAAEPQAITEAQVLAAFPEIAAIVNGHKQAQAQRKTVLMAQLKGKQDVYTEAELAGMSVSELERIARLAKVEMGPVDFSAIGAPRAAEAATPSTVEPPDPWAAGIAARQGK